MWLLKNKKILVLILVALILLGVLLLLEDFIKDNYSGKKVILSENKVAEKTIQSYDGYMYYVFKNWDRVFNLYSENDLNKLYNVKDYVEEYIEKDSTKKIWNVTKINSSKLKEEGIVTFSIESEDSMSLYKITLTNLNVTSVTKEQ